MNSRLPRILAPCALLLLLVSSSRAQGDDPSLESKRLNAEAMKAYQAKDYVRFLEDEKRALKLDPSSPRILYNVACGQALQGNPAEALRLLDQLVARRLDLGAEGDPDFAGLRNTPGWTGFKSKLAEMRRPIVHSQVAFRLADPGLLAAGIAVDPRTGDTYIASVRERKIVRRTRAGVVSDFIGTAQDGFLAGASLIIDPSRDLLYASTAAVPFMENFRKQDSGRAGVFAFDLKTGALARKAWLTADGKPHFLNALALDHHGNVYISDSAGSGIYRLGRESSQLEVFLPANVFTAAQGLAFSADDNTLYVADYSNGVWAVEMASKEKRKLEGPADVWLGGLDGLSWVKDSLIAVQIGVRPERVLRLRLDHHGKRIAKVEVLEMNHPDYAGPVQGVVAGNDFFYVANSQLALGNGETGAFAADRARPTVVLRLPL